MRLNLTFIIAVVFVGCATEFHRADKKYGYGYEERKISKDKFYVSFRGKLFTSEQKVLEYFHRRSSEITLEQGYDFYQPGLYSINAISNYKSQGRFQTQKSHKKGDHKRRKYKKNIAYSKIFTSYSCTGTIKLFKFGKQTANSLNARKKIKW